MKEEFFKKLCTECIKEEVEEMGKSSIDGLIGAVILMCMTSVLKRLEKKLKNLGLFDCEKGGEKSESFYSNFGNREW